MYENVISVPPRLPAGDLRSQKCMFIYASSVGAAIFRAISRRLFRFNTCTGRPSVRRELCPQGGPSIRRRHARDPLTRRGPPTLPPCFEQGLLSRGSWAAARFRRSIQHGCGTLNCYRGIRHRVGLPSEASEREPSPDLRKGPKRPVAVRRAVQGSQVAMIGILGHCGLI